MREQTVVVGYGVTGASAVRFLLRTGMAPADLTVLDHNPDAIAEAAALHLDSHLGDATDRATLAHVLTGHIRHVIITVRPDATAVMTTMAARDLCPTAVVLTAVHDDENAEHARRAGANQVIATSRWAGHTLAMALD